MFDFVRSKDIISFNKERTTVGASDHMLENDKRMCL